MIDVLTLSNGVRIVLLPRPHSRTAAVTVYVRTGALHETRVDNGISHVLEHMAFKGTATRSTHRVNLDAECLGAEVNAHTDKDHTAYDMRGLAADAPTFVTLLADIVRHATFPADELERERAVILQELTEVEDDPVSVGYQLFDRACWGAHAAALPVIGQRRFIEQVTREDLIGYVERQYTGANVVVAAAGGIDVAAIARAAQSAFGDMPAGVPNSTAPAAYVGGLRTRRMDGQSQAHLLVGFPVPSRADDDMACEVAAAAFGEGMSSPLLAELREKRGLVYHATCVADRFDGFGQLVIEASFAPGCFDEVLLQVARLLQAQAEGIAAVDLDRARRQVVARLLRDDERIEHAAERAALDLLTSGRVRALDELVERVRAVDADAAQAVVATMHAAGAAVALTGALPRQASQRARVALGMPA